MTLAFFFAIESGGIQLSIISVTSTMFFAFIVSNLPRSTRALNNIEIFNETFLKISEIVMFAFSDMNPNTSLKQKIGIIFQFGILFLVVANVLYMFLTSLLDPCKKKFRRKKKKAKKLKEIQ